MPDPDDDLPIPFRVSYRLPKCWKLRSKASEPRHQEKVRVREDEDERDARTNRLLALERKEAYKREIRLDERALGIPHVMFEGWFRDPEVWLAGKEPVPLPPADPKQPDITVIFYKEDHPKGYAIECARRYTEQVAAEKTAKAEAAALAKAGKRKTTETGDEGLGRIDGAFALSAPTERDLKKSKQRKK